MSCATVKLIRCNNIFMQERKNKIWCTGWDAFLNCRCVNEVKTYGDMCPKHSKPVTSTVSTADKVRVTIMTASRRAVKEVDWYRVFKCEFCEAVIMIHMREGEGWNPMFSVEIPCGCEMY